MSNDVNQKVFFHPAGPHPHPTPVGGFFEVINIAVSAVEKVMKGARASSIAHIEYVPTTKIATELRTVRDRGKMLSDTTHAESTRDELVKLAKTALAIIAEIKANNQYVHQQVRKLDEEALVDMRAYDMAGGRWITIDTLMKDSQEWVRELIDQGAARICAITSGFTAAEKQGLVNYRCQ
ncbi:hypothetical protein LTR17_020971 [Elasticomyces elasticus]|nr:hypothetical protein LTR17_020971 [Elasticomyces elasticus]